MAHCTDGNPVHFKGSRKELVQLLCKYGFPVDMHKTNKELCSLFTHPKNYERLLLKYPKLNFCLAHFGAGYRDWETDRKSTRLNSSHSAKSRMPSSA